MPELEDERFYEAHADFCAVFANANRLKLLDLLAEGEERSVSELVALSGISQSTISQHLKLMRDQGIVARERDGVNNYYSISDQRIVDGIEMARAVLRERQDSP